MIYYDSSALLKLVRPEMESEDFRQWYEERQDVDAVSSALVRVEVIRTAHQLSPAAERRARAVVAELDLIPMTWPLLDRAAVLPFAVRSLDAIHLASAMEMGSTLRVFVSYDRRLLAAAEEAGLPIEAPGAS